jgi:conjugal transfer pilus assembly protein TraF
MERRFMILRRSIAAFLVALAGSAHAQQASLHGDAYGDAFLNYEPYVTPAVPASAPPATAAAPAPPPAPAAAPDDGKQVASVAFLRKIYPELEERAIDNPTDANVSDYMYAKRLILDKAQRFSDAVARVLHEDPVLDENNRVPYASVGAQSVQNANYQAQQHAVEELSQIGGLLVFVDGSCRFCAMQLPILDMLRRGYNVQYFVISLDGTRPKGYKGTITADNGLFHKLGLKLTPSIVFVPHPRAYTGPADPNQYLIVSQGFYAEDQLIKQIAFAGHDTQLLSAGVMRDLNVWDRGVASTQDLNSLRLDPNQPGSFKAILQPYLLKQY